MHVLHLIGIVVCTTWSYQESFQVPAGATDITHGKSGFVAAVVGGVVTVGGCPVVSCRGYEI